MQKRILIVEDDNDLRDLLRIVLLEEGFQVDTCPEGKAAMQMLEAASESLSGRPTLFSAPRCVVSDSVGRCASF